MNGIGYLLCGITLLSGWHSPTYAMGIEPYDASREQEVEEEAALAEDEAVAQDLAALWAIAKSEDLTTSPEYDFDFIMQNLAGMPRISVTQWQEYTAQRIDELQKLQYSNATAIDSMRIDTILRYLNQIQTLLNKAATQADNRERIAMQKIVATMGSTIPLTTILTDTDKQTLQNIVLFYREYLDDSIKHVQALEHTIKTVMEQCMIPLSKKESNKANDLMQVQQRIDGDRYLSQYERELFTKQIQTAVNAYTQIAFAKDLHDLTHVRKNLQTIRKTATAENKKIVDIAIKDIDLLIQKQQPAVEKSSWFARWFRKK